MARPTERQLGARRSNQSAPKRMTETFGARFWSQTCNGKGTALPSAGTRIQPPPRSRTRPEADSWLGQNCGGHRLARIAGLCREVHVCLFCNLFQIRARNIAVFGNDVLLCGGNLRSNVSKRIKQTYLRHMSRCRKIFAAAPAYRLFLYPHRVNTRCVSSGDHPR